MAAIVVPFRASSPKLRLAPLSSPSRVRLARAMLADVLAAAAPLGGATVADGLGGQGNAVHAALMGLTGPVLVVNADLPCATTADLEQVLASAPAVVAARDGTTNALALLSAASFRPLYGPGSALRFAEHFRATLLDLPNLADDVDTLADLERVRARVGSHTRSAIAALGAAA